MVTILTTGEKLAMFTRRLIFDSRTLTLSLGLVILGASVSMAAPPKKEFSVGSSDPIVQYINERIKLVCDENEVGLSPMADDAEWCRRVYLDIVGHVPPAEVLEAFMADKDAGKRTKLVDTLLDDPDYVINMTTVWRNNLIGRNTPDKTSRAGMEKFLREAFARNRPWNEIVFDILTAEGHFEENGAGNFILAQLTGNPRSEDYHVELTAKTARLFLGMQVQCTQCHNHPFNDWKQNQFWEFNSFFRQVRRNDVEKYDPKSGQRVDDYSEIVSMDFEGPVYFETRQALMQVAYPRYLDEPQPIGSGIDVDRRAELAKKMCHDDPTMQIAKAYVNRTWGHFFGYGFTKPVDDMGPHNPPSHPEILDRLTDEFVKAGYDSKQLIRWIANTDAYHRTSKFTEKNRIDDPAAGEVAMFSHMYVKTMNMEQLYDSLIIATNAHAAGKASTKNRRSNGWMADFVRIFGSNKEDEPTLFSDSIPQALLMMNGPLVQKAIGAERELLAFDAF
ncbi:MAG: DUF1549 domain-containing protein [Planctomycetaceae bacterium]